MHEWGLFSKLSVLRCLPNIQTCLMNPDADIRLESDFVKYLLKDTHLQFSAHKNLCVCLSSVTVPHFTYLTVLINQFSPWNCKVNIGSCGLLRWVRHACVWERGEIVKNFGVKTSEKAKVEQVIISLFVFSVIVGKGTANEFHTTHLSEAWGMWWRLSMWTEIEWLFFRANFLTNQCYR